MKGMTRKIDGVGRVALPKTVLDSLGWNIGQKLDMELLDDGVTIKKSKAVCFRCGSETDLLEMQDSTKLCVTCAQGIKAMLEAYRQAQDGDGQNEQYE